MGTQDRKTRRGESLGVTRGEACVSRGARPRRSGQQKPVTAQTSCKPISELGCYQASETPGVFRCSSLRLETVHKVLDLKFTHSLCTRDTR